MFNTLIPCNHSILIWKKISIKLLDFSYFAIIYHIFDTLKKIVSLQKPFFILQYQYFIEFGFLFRGEGPSRDHTCE